MSDQVAARMPGLSSPRWLLITCGVIALLYPWTLFYSRAAAEVFTGLMGAAFLAHCAINRDWSWLQATWMKFALGWWLWLVFCSAIGNAGHAGLVQALVAFRFPLMAAALGAWVLSEDNQRRRLFLVLTICAAWLVSQCWEQYLTGTSLSGIPKFYDGTLTGPFHGLPRAGSAFALFAFPVLFPWAFRLMDRNGIKGNIAAGLLLGLALITMVLIGQRMPMLLMLFGMVVISCVLPEARRLALPALAIGVLALALSPIISPLTFQKLVIRFSDQMAHFPTSDYGMLYMRAIVMLNAHPWFGDGHDAFRNLCSTPSYFHDLSWLRVPDPQAGGLGGCNNHPHNFYLEAATAAGWPGLILFSGMTFSAVLALWQSAARPSGKAVKVLRLALFTQIVVAFWPFAAANDFLSLPNVGWNFLILGWGLAEARSTMSAD